MQELQTIKIARDIKAILVPFGNEVDVPMGTEAIVLQALGGTYTIVAGGQTLRVSSVYGDALEGLQQQVDGVGTGGLGCDVNDPHTSLEEKVWALLRSCYDPEIPVNIVDLGLIYGVAVEPWHAQADDSAEENSPKDEKIIAGEEGEFYKVIIRMTLTAPGCGMGPIIANEAKQKVLAIPKVKAVTIAITFDPPWDRSRLSEAAKLALGLM